MVQQVKKVVFGSLGPVDFVAQLEDSILDTCLMGKFKLEKLCKRLNECINVILNYLIMLPVVFLLGGTCSENNFFYRLVSYTSSLPNNLENWFSFHPRY